MDLREAVRRAIDAYGMVPRGARVLLALSGGKDSLALLHLLAELRADLGMDLAAAHVETDTGCGAGIFERVLAGLCAGLGVPAHRVRFPILAEAGDRLTCYYCAMRRRAALFSLAVREGFDTLAFGHHMDDMAETLVMNAVFHGNLSTMTPRVAFFEGGLRVIRPLAFVREAQTRACVQELGLSTAVCGCPYSTDNVRAAVKRWLREVDETDAGAAERVFEAMRSLGRAS
jgi:tRNA 2-thiocytidine biosynthesis protein TtcA